MRKKNIHVSAESKTDFSCRPACIPACISTCPELAVQNDPLPLHVTKDANLLTSSSISDTNVNVLEQNDGLNVLL
jgi:hypothetical protein